jgi:hypothetical protein
MKRLWLNASRHLDAGEKASLKDILGCNKKLRLSTYAPKIAKADKYLAGWQASRLNHMGRATLVNSVLDSQLVYAMCALVVPPGVIEQVDRRRRAFLWTSSDSANGAKSLVAWTHVCDTKDRGGLGLKDMKVQNTCLLLKLIHRISRSEDSSWVNWVRQNANIASLQGNLHGHHWESLRKLLLVYRAITPVLLGNGEFTSFWYDAWDGDDPIADRFPELHSH